MAGSPVQRQTRTPAPGSLAAPPKRPFVSLIGLLALAAWMGSCSVPDWTYRPRPVAWDVEITPADLRSDARVVVRSIVPGGCTTGDAEAYRDEAEPHVTRWVPPLRPGRYGLRAEARDAACRVIAESCEDVELPVAGRPIVQRLAAVTSSTPACPVMRCADGRCDGVPAGPGSCSWDPAGAPIGEAVVPPCTRGMLDCDGDGLCEIDGRVDRTNCGGCGTRCGDHEGCWGSRCDVLEEVSLGDAHGCARRRSDGGVLCWGRSTGLGAQTWTSRSVPDGVRGLPGPALDLGANAAAACAVMRDGKVWCWIAEQPPQPWGAFADAVEVVSTCVRTRPGDVFCRDAAGNPARVEGIPPVAGLAMGHGSAACAWTAEGAVWCWDWRAVPNAHGELGDGTTDARAEPAEVEGVTNVIDVAVGPWHVCAATRAGPVLCWGESAHGQLGSAPGPFRVLAPAQVPCLRDVVELVAGQHFTCARLASGDVLCWGRADDDPLQANRAVPTPDSCPSTPARDSRWIGIADAVGLAASGGGACALRATGALECWGTNAHGQLGRGEPRGSRPVRVGSAENGADLQDARQVVAGGEQVACSTDRAGALRCWGHGGLRGSGQVEGLAGHVSSSRAVSVAFDQPVGKLSAAGYAGLHICLVTAGQGGVACFGHNDFGQLGVTGAGGAATPAPLALPEPATQIATGDTFTIALTDTGTLFGWGANDSGQLGGTTAMSQAPAQIEGASGVSAVAAGYRHTCYVVGGRVLCLGDGQYFGLEQGPRSTPVEVPGLTDAVAVSTGYAHGCAVRADGTVACWGSAGDGELGLGCATRSTARALMVPRLGGVVALSAGGFHTCAARRSAPPVCWGWNASGQLGDGTTVDRWEPVEVVGLGVVDEIAAGRDSTCAVAAGQVWCWGDRAQGQLGDGVVLYDPAPAPVVGSP